MRKFILLITSFLWNAGYAHFIPYQCALINPYFLEESYDSSWDKGFCLDIPIHKAWSLRDEIQKSNLEDLTKLYGSFISELKNLSSEQKHLLKLDTLSTLRQDKMVLKDTAKQLGTGGSYEFRTSLHKLIGNKSTTGILDDTVILLQKDKDWFLKFKVSKLAGNQITVAKTLFIYIHASLEKMKDVPHPMKLGETLQIIYPATVDPSVDSPRLASVVLYDSSSSKPLLWIPNAGYIFGGNFQNSKIRGLDCSSYLSFCTNASLRLSTADMEIAARFILEDVSGIDCKNYRCQKTVEEFDPILVSSVDDLYTGDLIVWRQGGSGHVVMFVDRDFSDETKRMFQAIEDTREDNKMVEGIVEKTHPLFKKGKKLFVLRRHQR